MRLLGIDIETSAATVSTWGIWNANIGINQIQVPTRVICFAARWEGQRRSMFFSEFEHGHEEMVRQAHALLDEADAVMGWNSKGFDIPHLNREFLLLGLKPPAPFQQIDLMLAVKKQFRFLSNKLDWVSQQVIGDRKVQHSGYSLWEACLRGDEKAWRLMAKYNRQDVDLLFTLYEQLKPWIPSHPNRALIDGVSDGCPACGGTHLQRRGWAFTKVSEYPRYQCQDCGKWSRGQAREIGSSRTEVAA